MGTDRSGVYTKRGLHEDKAPLFPVNGGIELTTGVTATTALQASRI